jgi:hypothetical protein
MSNTTEVVRVFNILSGRDFYYGSKPLNIVNGLCDWLESVGYICYADGYCLPANGVHPRVSPSFANYVFAKCEALSDSIPMSYSIV